MVWIEDWGSFAVSVREIFIHSPTTARFALKYRRRDSLLSIKVTDNISCIKYRASSVGETRQIERLATAFLRWLSLPASNNASGPSLDGIIAPTGVSSPKKSRAKKPQKAQRKQQHLA